MISRKRPRPSGFTLLEVLVSLGALGMILVITFLVLQQSTASWRRVSGSQDSSSQVLRAEQHLRRDLSMTSFDEFSVSDAPLSNLSGRDGDAVWFLSALDPDSGRFIRNSDGTPRWQRNVLYYLAVPSGPRPGGFSGGGLEQDGYEVSYPFKLLIRKVIDYGPPTDSTDSTPAETLIPDISPYLETPHGFQVGKGAAESVGIVARDLLTFRVRTDTDLRRVTVLLRAANHVEAARDFALGSAPLDQPKYLFERRLELFPQNRSPVLPTP